MTLNPDRAIDSVSVLTESERARLLVDLNRTDRQLAHATVHGEIERRARERPDSPALIDGDRSWSYRELVDATDRLVASMRDAGVGRGDPVVVSMPRSAEAVVALLATMRAGAAYVAIDPDTPGERRQAIVEDAAPAMALTSAALLPDFVAMGIDAVDVHSVDLHLDGDDAHDDAQGVPDPPALDVSPDDPMFIVFTSGSTGRPKGVPGTHRAVLNRCRWQAETYPFDDDEITCQKTTLGFVDHVAELWAPLVAGRPVVIIPDGVVRDPEAFVSMLAHHAIRRIVMVPSLLEVLLDAIDDLGERLPRLRLWTSSGERLPRSIADRFRVVVPHATLLNVYGMSEVMADATCFDGAWADAEESVPIGRPIDNLRVYVLDHVGRPAPVGVPGQIWISGIGLTAGYWRRDDLTAERICINPFGDGDHGRRYATGDIGRWTHDGQLVYLGRLDRQVKVRGMRVELGDVEAAIRGFPGVRDVVVDASSDHGQTRLVACLVADDECDIGGLRRHLAERVPHHLVPSEFDRIAAIPLLPSGKVDHRAIARVVADRGPNVDDAVVDIDEHLATMISIWRDVIGTDDLGPDDDFFDVGGHSIAGMRLLSRIKRSYDVNLELSVLYTDPTPRTLLARVRAIASGAMAEARVDRPRHLVEVASGNDERRTLYCVHGAGGNVLNIRDLALELSPRWRTVGIQASGVDGVTPPHATIDAMCEAYIAEIVADRPDGPLFLAGFSAGGIIAYEMAIRLAARGRPVAAVVLLDTFHPSIEGRRRTVREHAAALWSEGPAYLLHRREGRRKRRLYAHADEIVQAAKLADGTVPPELRDAHMVANVRSLLDSYETPDYDGPVWLFAASDVLDVYQHAGADRGWRRSATDVRCEPVPGGHEDFILEPHVRVLADRLRARLDEAVTVGVVRQSERSVP
jgi:amino acid adenylation domain-containing protein